MTDNNTLSRRRFLQATGGAAGAVALAGCTGGDGDDGTTTSAETTTSDGTTSSEGTTYRLTNSSLTTFDPIKSTGTASGRIIQNVFDALTNYPNGETTVENLLAKDYETSEGGKKLTFTLKEGVKYSNGDELTANDFVYSFERLAASSNSRRKSFILGDLGVKHETNTTTNDKGEEVEVYKPGTMAVKAVDDYTLEIQLEQPFHASLEMLAYTSFSAIPEGIVGDIDGYDGEMEHGEFAKKTPIGTGPFTLEKWQQGTEASLKARGDDYHGEGPYVDRVHYQILEKTNALYTYRTKNVNGDHPYVPPSKYQPEKVNIEGTDDRGRKYGTYGPLENGLTADYHRTLEVGTFYYGFNSAKVEKAARKAFAYAFNQQEMVEEVIGKPYKEAFFFTPPTIFPGGAEKYDEMAKEYPYGYNEQRLEDARAVMEEAGYSDSNRYSFTLTTYEANYHKEMATLMRDKLSSAYIDMKFEQAPFSTLLERGRKGNLEAYTLGWIADYPAPDNFLKLLNPTFTETGPTENTISYLNWFDTEASQRASDAWQKFKNNPGLTDAAKQARADAYMEIEKANWEDMVMLTTHHRATEHFAYEWVDRPRIGAMGGSRQKLNTVKIGDRGEHQ
ncbi:ABC transporter substrate-binding protein [Halobacteriaceae archaeon GCM10025711]